MKRKLFVLIGLISIIAIPCFSAGEYNVDNYFQSPGSGDDNDLIISGTQTVSGYLSITGAVNNSGVSSLTGTLNKSVIERVIADSTSSSLQASSTVVITSQIETIISSGSVITVTSTPMISTSTYGLGTKFTLRVSSQTSTTYGAITIQDNGSLTNSGFSLWGANKTLNFGDEVDLELQQPPGQIRAWYLKAFKDYSGDIVLANEETISNATNGTVAISGDLQVTGGNMHFGNSSAYVGGGATTYEIDISTQADMNSYPIVNIGATTTDFDSSGRLDIVEAGSTKYAVKIASNSTTSVGVAFGGIHATLPTSGYDAGTLVVYTGDSSYDLYISTEAVSGSFSWEEVGSQ